MNEYFWSGYRSKDWIEKLKFRIRTRFSPASFHKEGYTSSKKEKDSR